MSKPPIFPFQATKYTEEEEEAHPMTHTECPTQERHDPKQKTTTQTTMSEGDRGSKSIPSQNPTAENMTKANSAQILLSRHNKETTSEDIFKMFNPHEAPEINRQGDYTILTSKTLRQQGKGSP